MSLTLGNKTNSLSTPTITTKTFAHNNGGGSNNYLFLMVCTDDATSYVGATYNGVAMTLVAEHTDSVYSERIAYYYLASPATGSNNVVVTFDIEPYNPVSCEAFSYSDCAGAGNTLFDDTAGSPNTGSITVSANSQIFGVAVGGTNAGKNITINGSSRTLEFTNNVYNYIYGAFSASGLSAGSISTSVANSSDVMGYFIEIKEAAASSTQGLLLMI